MPYCPSLFSKPSGTQCANDGLRAPSAGVAGIMVVAVVKGDQRGSRGYGGQGRNMGPKWGQRVRDGHWGGTWVESI